LTIQNDILLGFIASVLPFANGEVWALFLKSPPPHSGAFCVLKFTSQPGEGIQDEQT
jgi:hypothetical protein